MPSGLTLMTKETEEQRLQRLARDTFERPKAKRFYKTASLGMGGTLLLDGRKIRTPMKAVVEVPFAGLADAMLDEWLAQGQFIDTATMPLTKLTYTAIDRAVSERDRVIADLAKYADADMVCYWAEGPDGLVAAQRTHWLPVVAWAQSALSAKFEIRWGIVHQSQDASCATAVRNHIETLDNWALTGVYNLATLLSSVLLALRLHARGAAAEATWTSAHVDEDFQISQWGEDWEAAQRRAARRREFDALVRFLDLVRS
jgi:chaperone required for assembly of F1-ATPase